MEVSSTSTKLKETERSGLKAFKRSPEKKRIPHIFPFIDEECIIKVGGRVDNALISDQTRHTASILTTEFRC